VSLTRRSAARARPALTVLVVAALAGTGLIGIQTAGPAYAAAGRGAVVGASSVGGSSRPATGPTPLRGAQAQARELRLSVDRLRVQAEQAAEAYDAADALLGQVVTEHLSAQRDLDAATANAGRQDRTAAERVRALYKSGGAPALYATVLQGGDISDVLSRMQSVNAVLTEDRSVSDAAGRSVDARRSAEARLGALAARQTRLQTSVAQRADSVRTLLARTDALLAGADVRVRALAEQQRRAQEAAAARAALARLAAAEQKAQADALAAAAASAAAAAAASATATAAAAAAGTAAAGPARPGGTVAPSVGYLPAPSTAVPLQPTSQTPSQAAAVAVAVAVARAQVGKPYLWGAVGPDSYDCSGLTLSAYLAAGIALPRTAQQQWYAGPHVPLGALAPGDLLFWASDPTVPSSIHHVAMYLGGGLMVAAPHSGTLVRIEPLYLTGYVGAVRPTG